MNSTIIASIASSGSYSWPIPSGQAAGADYKVRITSTTNSSLYDESNNYFTIGIPTNLPLQNINIGSGQSTCYNATQTITVAGNGTNFVVQSSGIVHLIAGQNILLLTGVTVNSGGNLHAYISTNGIYCSSPVKFLNDSLEKENHDIEITPMAEANYFFKIYPNPTTGTFTLELSDGIDASFINIEIYTMQGNKVLSHQLKGERKHIFSLSEMIEGMYFLRVTNGNYSGSRKIVKQ